MTAAYGGGAAEQVVTALLGVTSGLIANALYELLRNNVVGLSDRADLELTHEDALMILESELNRQFPDAFDDRPSVVDSIVAEHISGSRWSFELVNSTHCFEVDVARTLTGTAAAIRRTRLKKT